MLTSGRRQLSVIRDDGSSCARRLPVCHAFVSPHPHCRFRLLLRQRMSSDVCLAISALRLRVRSSLQLSVVATCTTECGRLFQDSQFLEKSNATFCCTARLTNNVRTIIPGTSHRENGVLLEVSTTLRLRDHFCAQDQMFRRHAARVALCFGVRIQVVMASPSVMAKVVFLLETEERCFVRSVWRASLCGRGTDVHGRHVAFQRESPRDAVASYATTPHHVTAPAQEVAHENAAYCTPLHAHDTCDDWPHSHS